MKRLIVNTDDLGADSARNEGIFEAIDAGVVTSASILPNGPALEDALQRIRSSPHWNVSFGVHINLSEGSPLSGPWRFLIGENGLFRGKAETRRLLMQPGNRELEETIEREIAAQIKVLLKSGVVIRHLDGHQHVHVFPAVRRAVLRAAEGFHIPWVRFPEDFPPPSWFSMLSKELVEEAQDFSRVAQEARSLLGERGIRTTDHFRGIISEGNPFHPFADPDHRGASPRPYGVNGPSGPLSGPGAARPFFYFFHCGSAKGT